MNSLRRWPMVVAVAGLLPVLYVLSEAPLVRLTGEAPHGGYWSVYKPVDWLYYKTPVRPWLDSWIGLWGAKRQWEQREIEQLRECLGYSGAPLPPLTPEQKRQLLIFCERQQ